MSIINKISKKPGPLGQFKEFAHGYYTFPKLEGDIASHMFFQGKEILCWSLNDYLGLSNHPEVRKVDSKVAENYGMGYPMGARMMTGNTKYHEQLEEELADFVHKEDSILLNYGFQGMFSAIQALVDRNDVIIYDAESHACIVDGVHLHLGMRFTYRHNDIAHLERQLIRAGKLIENNGGAILVITEGVFGMNGHQGKLKEIVALKEKYNFTLFVDDAHGIGVMGSDGSGTGTYQGIQEGIDLYFGTFAKAFATIGAFIAGKKVAIDFLRYNIRSQIFAKALPLPIVLGVLTRLEIIRKGENLRKHLWDITHRMQKGLRMLGLNIGETNTPVTPVFLSGEPQEAVLIVRDLREEHGVFCSAVAYPVVPKGVIILRLIPTASHTFKDVDKTIRVFGAINKKLALGEYKQPNNIRCLS